MLGPCFHVAERAQCSFIKENIQHLIRTPDMMYDVRYKHSLSGAVDLRICPVCAGDEGFIAPPFTTLAGKGLNH